MKIKSVEIKGLWHMYDLSWRMNDRVNVLAGSNGSGKTTILTILSSLITKGKVSAKLAKKYDKAIITFDNGTRFININFRDTIAKLQKKAMKDEVFMDLWHDVDEHLSEEKRNQMNSISIQASVSYFEKGRKRVPIQQQLELANALHISSFEFALPATYDTERLKQLNDEGVESVLDLRLHDLLTKYAYYSADIANKLEVAIREGRIFSNREMQELYLKKNTFLKLLDFFFDESGKHVNYNTSALEFIAEDGVTSLSVYQLSSGEKQLVQILLSVLLEKEKELILLLDEPDVSLHIDWQENLIRSIRDLNPNCQVIVTTHSPSMVIGGWQECVTVLDTIKQRV